MAETNRQLASRRSCIDAQQFLGRGYITVNPRLGTCRLHTECKGTRSMAPSHRELRSNRPAESSRISFYPAIQRKLV
jgi:hypothetical protein